MNISTRGLVLLLLFILCGIAYGGIVAITQPILICDESAQCEER